VQRDVKVDIDPASLAEAVDPGTYERGVQYVRQHAVVRALWKLSAGALAGTVRGQYGNIYTTTARFSSADGLVHRFERGECSCPVRFDCKHVVALVLTATGALRPDGKEHAAETGAPADEATAGAGQAMWEQSLASLLTSGRAGSPGTVRVPGTAAGTPRWRSSSRCRFRSPCRGVAGPGPIRCRSCWAAWSDRERTAGSPAA
jgi:hypothetical protein